MSEIHVIDIQNVLWNLNIKMDKYYSNLADFYTPFHLCYQQDLFRPTKMKNEL